jgi:hypothetical protein
MMDNLNTIYFAKEIKAKGISIDDYNEWVTDFGIPLASIGEEGRQAFHIISSTSTKYDGDKTNKKFDTLVKTRNGNKNIESFYHKCLHEMDIKPPQNNGFKLSKAKLKDVIKVEEENYLFNLHDILNAEPEETIWAFLTKGVNNALVASSEAGKTTLFLNLALAIIKGEEKFLGWPINAPKRRMLYIASEDGISQMRKKLEALTKGYDLDPDSFLCIFDTHNILERLPLVLSKTPCDLIVFDTWGDLVGGRYDAEFTRKTMQDIRRICVEHDGTPVFVHHTNKLSENIPDKGSVKGAGDFEQACRVVMFLTIFRDSRWLCCVKGNPFPEDNKSTCYELLFNYEQQAVTRGSGEMPRLEIIRLLKAETIGRPETDIDWVSILDMPMRHKDLVQKVMESSGIGISQAKARITSAKSQNIINQNENGLYWI